MTSTKASRTKDMDQDQQAEKKLKKPNTWLLIFIGAMLLILILLAVCRRYLVVAIVNGKPIFWYQYVTALEKQSGQQILDQIILEKLVADAAAKQNITVPAETVEAEINKIQTSLASQSMTLDQALANEGLTLAQLQQQIWMRQLVTALASKDVSVSATEVTDYINKNKSSLPTGKDKPENFEALIYDQLLKSKQQDAIKNLLNDLKQQAKIQYW